MYALLLAIIYVAFISLGLPDSLAGAGWPVMHGDLGVPVSFAGILTTVIAVGTIDELLALDHPWIQEYFNGPRGRAALTAQALDELKKHMDMPFAANAVKALDMPPEKKA